MNWNKYLFTEDEFILEMDSLTVKRILTKNDFLKFTAVFEDGQYVIRSNISVGVLIINGYKGMSVSTHAKITADEEKTIVHLKSSVRPEYYLITFAFIFFLAIGFIKDFGWSSLGLSVFFIITFLWFRLIIQSQEESLHQVIKTYFQNLDDLKTNKG
ncbi:hypothetical protein [Flavobacterium sp. 102]|uniref:hypothetical protein n=1 Tax=Flavobacterium sp. 102 TaxID=2135623 RepID=UPI000EAFB44A|nr:hypothetical protein [Flavobacterium sp. 102]RKS03113.1 hypothetical protein C8C84_2854 [Flavobacterium sp. 102]